MKKRRLPPIKATDSFLDAVKENLEIITGQRGGKVEELPATATLDDVISKLNEIIARLQ